MDLVWPARQYLRGYVRALEQGWSPDNLRLETAQDHLAQIAEDAADFVSRQVNCTDVDNLASRRVIEANGGTLIERFCKPPEYGGVDARSWESLVNELDSVRGATVSLFADLPDQAWDGRGIASGNPFTVRALAWLAAGHVTHHVKIVLEKYTGRTP